jgi:hypothetical protein
MMQEHDDTAISKHAFPELPGQDGTLDLPDGTFVEQEQGFPFVLMQREIVGRNHDESFVTASLSTSLVLRATYQGHSTIARTGFVRLSIADDKRKQPLRFQVAYEDLHRAARTACDSVKRIQNPDTRPSSVSLAIPITPQLRLVVKSPGRKWLFREVVLFEFGLATTKDYYQVTNAVSLFELFVELFDSKRCPLTDQVEEFLAMIRWEST